MPRTTRRVGRPAKRATRSSRAAEPTEIFVKLARTGGAVYEMCLNGDRTVEALFNAAKEQHGFEYRAGERIKVNGVSSELSTTLKDGQRVTVSGKIQGGTN